MLVLSRRLGESVKIGDDITVTILSIRGMQVSVGIAAPGDVSIHREEVFLRLRAALAATAGDSDRN